MASFSEQDVFDFIDLNANPTVSLARVKGHFGTEGAGMLRMFLGSLYRKSKIFRQDSTNVLYWTARTATLVERAGIKASPLNKTESVPNVATTNYLAPNSTIKHPLALPSEDRVPVMEEQEEQEGSAHNTHADPSHETHETPSPWKIAVPPEKPQHVPTMGRMRESSALGKLAHFFWKNRHGTLTRTDLLAVFDVSSGKLGQMLNNLVAQRIITRRAGYPITNSRFFWSGIFLYPFSEYSAEDSSLLKSGIDAHKRPTHEVETAKCAVEDPPQSDDEDDAPASPWTYIRRPFATSVCANEAEDMKAELEAIADLEAKEVAEKKEHKEVEGSIDGASEDDVVAAQHLKSEPEVPNFEAQNATASNLGRILKEELEQTDLYALVAGPGLSISNSILNSFDAQLNTRGELTIFKNGSSLTLTKEQVKTILSLIGPHYNQTSPKLFD